MSSEFKVSVIEHVCFNQMNGAKMISKYFIIGLLKFDYELNKNGIY